MLRNCRDNEGEKEKKGRDHSKRSLPSRRYLPPSFFASSLLIIQSGRYPPRYHCAYRERPCVSGVRMHARQRADEDGPSRRCWSAILALMSSRAPSTQPRNADFLVAIVLYFIFSFFSFIFFFSLLILLSSLPRLSSALRS